MCQFIVVMSFFKFGLSKLSPYQVVKVGFSSSEAITAAKLLQSPSNSFFSIFASCHIKRYGFHLLDRRCCGHPASTTSPTPVCTASQTSQRKRQPKSPSTLCNRPFPCRRCTCLAQHLVDAKHLVGLEPSGNRISHRASHLCSQQNSQSRAESWDVFARALWGKHMLQHAATDTVASEHLSDAVELEEKCSSQSSK